ncbi:MAG TPA: glycoside hydrolase family 9 protein [Acidobacteriaceae bacterium]|nr:glycoside hydrolase family 9 protein [Acidobacteriaceae bacterium]
MLRRSLLKTLGLSGMAAMVDSTRLRANTPVADTHLQLPVAGFNQVGYLPRAQKKASVLLPSGKNAAGAEFQLLSDAGAVAFHGPLSAPGKDAASGDTVTLADFSAVTTPGVYTIAVGGRRSAMFSIAGDVYRDPLRLAMRSYYGQRCGCAVDLGGGYKHDACHLAAAWHASSGRTGPIANRGGWHDAGDYGRYVVNSSITVATLLWAWEFYTEALRKLRLQIPESNQKTPDYLSEVRWNLEWMLSLQDRDGQDADGGVWHKQTSEQFCGFILPERDTLTSYVIGTGAAPFKSTCATADLAAVAAIAARIYGEFDSAFAAKCLAAAKSAWSWAMAHPAVVFTNPSGVATGEYGDKHCGDELLWASAELWRTTGEAQYERALLDAAATLPAKSVVWIPSWANVAPLGYWTWLMAGRKSSDAKRSEPLQAAALEQTMSAATTLTNRAATSGYGATLGLEDYVWGSNSVAANQSLLLLVANRLQPNAQLVETALGNLHYLLGRNCFGVSWVTQVGSNPLQHPHHRPSAADGIAAPWPGLLSGGPNAHPSDAASKGLPQAPPMRMWLDDQSAYSLNEVAINWNAPLVFLLAAANSLQA